MFRYSSGLQRLWTCTVAGAVVVASVALGAVGAAAAGEPAANDAFNRADSSSLGAAPSGQSWQSHANGFSVVGGQAVAPGGYGLTTLDAGAGPATVSVTVAQPGQEFWVVLRLADGANFWRFGRSQGGQYQLQQIQNNGLGSPSLTSLATVTPAAGDRIECSSGAVLQCSVNGTAVVRTSNSFGSTAGKHGLSTWDSQGVRFDDFSVVAIPQLADLVTSLSAPAVVPSGGTFSATATVVNTGAAIASGAAVEWTPPTGVALSAPPGTTCSTSGSTVRCPVGDLAPGATGSVTLTATAPSGSGTVSLPARAVSAGSDATPADNSATATVTLRPDLSPSTVVSDGFTRTDGASLGRSDTGALWTTHSGNAGVTNNRAAPGYGYVLATTESEQSTGLVAATVTATAPELWLVMRLSSGADYWRFGRSSGGAYELQQIRNNGLGSPSLDRVASVTPETGDRIECKLGASLITCSVDGQVVVRSGDSFNRDATKHGFAAYNASDLRLDDFLVEKATARPDLRTTVAAPATMPGSSAATVTTTVRNVGTASAPGTTVRVTLPQGLSPDTASASSGSCVRSTSVADCTVGSVAAGSTVTITVSARADATFGTRTVTAAATSSAADEDTSDNTGSASVNVLDPSQPAPLVIDTFARGNGSLGSADTGQAWQVLAGSPAVSSQAAAPGGGHTLATVNAGTSTGVVSAKVTEPGSEFWLILRASGSADYWRFGRSSGGAYQLQLDQGQRPRVPRPDDPQHGAGSRR